MKLALGSAQFGQNYGIANQTGQVPQKEIKNILNIAYENGVETIDTAKAYGNSEILLGQNGVSRFKVISKLPKYSAMNNNCNDWVLDGVSDTLFKLRIDTLDTILIHNVEDILGEFGDQIFEKLLDCKNKGMIEKIGVSIYDSDDLDLILEKFDVDVIQGPLNILDQRLDNSGHLKKLKKLGIEFHARSIFLQGILLLSKIDIPPFFRLNEPKLLKWLDLQSNADFDCLGACLNYPINNDSVTKVLVGIDNTEQLIQILEKIKVPLGQYDISSLSSNNKDVIDPRNWGKFWGNI
jgi:aryl-alcohol dehydrogenase-like predicted oxidoreductase